MIELTSELIDRLQEWQSKGKRSFEISKSANRDNQTKVWIYDYKASDGVYLTNATVNNDWDSLTHGKKIERLRAELAALEAQENEQATV